MQCFYVLESMDFVAPVAKTLRNLVHVIEVVFPYIAK